MRLFAIAAALLLLADVRAGAHQKETLQVAVEDAADPWSRADGTGFANDVVREAFQAAGVQVRFLVVPYARCRSMAIEGAVAACFSMSAAPDQKGTVRFPSQALFQCFTELLQNPSWPLKSGRLHDLPRGTVVGTVIGYEYPPEVRRAAATGAIRLEESASETILLRKLAAHRLSAALVNLNESKPLDYVRALAGVTSGVGDAGRVGTLSSYIGFSVRHPRGAWALEKFDRGMRRLSASGALVRLRRRWADSSAATVRAQPVSPKPRLR